MAGPMKMRATLAGGNTDLRVLMTHPMTTAQSGQPLHFIQNITVKLNGKTVVDFVDEKNTHAKGYLALQQHDPKSVVRYRNLMAKPLSATEK